MDPEKGNAPAVAAAGATAILYSDRATSIAELEAHAQAGKALAVWLYCVGARSFRETQAPFHHHPEWAAA